MDGQPDFRRRQGGALFYVAFGSAAAFFIVPNKLSRGVLRQRSFERKSRSKQCRFICFVFGAAAYSASKLTRLPRRAPPMYQLL
jgi:hypothetical protein